MAPPLTSLVTDYPWSPKRSLECEAQVPLDLKLIPIRTLYEGGFRVINFA